MGGMQVLSSPRPAGVTREQVILPGLAGTLMTGEACVGGRVAEGRWAVEEWGKFFLFQFKCHKLPQQFNWRWQHFSAILFQVDVRLDQLGHTL